MSYESYDAPSNLDAQMEDVTRQTHERQEAERKAREARDRATAERLTAVNLTGIRSSEGVVDRFMPDVDMQTGGSSGSAGPMNESTEQKRSGQATGESPAKAKAKASEPVVIYTPKAKAPSPSSSSSAPASSSTLALPSSSAPKQALTNEPSAVPKQAPKMSQPIPEPSTGSKVKKEPKPKAMSQPRKTIEKAKVEHGVKLDENTDRAYWEKKTTIKAYIIDQLGLRGHRDPQALKKALKHELVDMIMEAIKRDKK